MSWKRSLLSGVATVALVASATVAAPPAHAVPPPTPGTGPEAASHDTPATPDGSAAVSAAAAQAKIQPTLRQRLASADTAPFWVRLRARADLSAAYRIDDWSARGRWVAKTLRETAESSQAGVRAKLDRAGVTYRTYWASNAIYVPAGSAELALDLATTAEVESLHPNQEYQLPEPQPAPAVPAVDGVEWGVANIRADEVWEQYGTGANIVVANIDTGVQYDHPALVGQYRGNNGDGTFDHNYNWFDAAGTCAGAPCDREGHGTHTMGTMAGSDGGANRIGVAPGVRWIAANGCCPSDEALVRSGQWMLEPTDLNGQNPDTDKRPHVVNNSWGSRAPSNSPFMEDITLAWAASGIFGVWSNGNSGPACQTSGSPGSLASNYSVGAYDSTGEIARFSSRGSGQNGEIKPNISAPGVAVRSAVPGSGYQAYDGTSMAAPHVAGTVALLWSAAPGLIGDIDATRQLLDGTAIDAPNGQCGGTAEDNNVFGEGRLDALALLDAAPVGDAATFTARVTDARSGEPLAGATIAVDGPVRRERVTGADGRYTLPLPAGDYTVRVSAFGHRERVGSVTVRAGGAVERAFALDPLPTSKVEGRITDGSGQGWPLYAKITVAGVPNGTFYTQPNTGRYSFTLPEGASYTMIVEPRSAGYQPVTRTFEVGKRNVRQDVAVPVEPESCTAPGYRHTYRGVGTKFDTGLPEGWTVTDEAGTGQVWQFDDPRGRGNLTGGSGTFAIVDSYHHGSSGRQDTSLVTPVADLTGVDAPVIEFRQDFNDHREVATVELSLDGGETWSEVFRHAGSARGPRTETIAIPQAANQPRVRVRFHYVGNWADWWQVDDVYVGLRDCSPIPGVLVVGRVLDRNTKEPLVGATVAGPTAAAGTAGASVRSVTTPDDPGLADGFYSVFAEQESAGGTVGNGAGAPGVVTVTASADRYQPQRLTIPVQGKRLVQREFRLAAGRLSVGPAEISVEARPGGTRERSIAITNTGTAPATIQLWEGGMPYPPVGAAPTATNGITGAPVVRVPGTYSPLRVDRAALAAAARSAAAQRGPDEPAVGPWRDLAEYPIRIMSNAVGEIDGRIYSAGGIDGLDTVAAAYVYDPVAGAWSPIAPLPEPREDPAGVAIDGTFYVAGGWGSNGRETKTLYAYDPATDTWRSLAPMPYGLAAPGRAVLDGKLYLVGGCTNVCSRKYVQRYDPATDQWERLADYPRTISHVACAGIGGKLYCAGGTSQVGATNLAYVYDPATDTWSPRASLPIDLWGAAYTAAYGQLVVAGGVTSGELTNQAFAYDPGTDSWLTLPASNGVTYRGGSACGLYRVGGSTMIGFIPTNRVEMLPTYGACQPTDLPWLALDTGTITLAPGKRITVPVRLTADAAATGTLRGGIWIKEETPYLVEPIAVTLRVR